MAHNELWAPGDYTMGNPEYHRDAAWALRLGTKLMVAAGAVLFIGLGVDAAQGEATPQNESDMVQLAVIDILAAASLEAGRVHHERQGQRFTKSPRTE